MEQQENQDINYQFLWTVPPQPLVNTHAVVETNQQRIPLDLNVISTDWYVVGSIVLSFFTGKKSPLTCTRCRNGVYWIK